MGAEARPRMHYAWVVVAITGLVVLSAAGARAAPGVLFGWIFFSHMVGAALAAYLGGFFRVTLSDYHLIFLSAAAMGFVAVALSMSISPSARPRAALAT